jgi:hypothetical protein
MITVTVTGEPNDPLRDSLTMLAWEISGTVQKAGRSCQVKDEATGTRSESVVDNPDVLIYVPATPAALDVLIKRARAVYDAMSPEERRAHDEAQRDSWVRGNLGIDRAEREEGRTTRIAPKESMAKVLARTILRVTGVTQSESAVNTLHTALVNFDLEIKGAIGR